MAIHRALALIFLFVFVPVAAFIAVAAPPGETPDEATQTARAGSLLHGQVLGFRAPGVDGAGQPLANAGVMANLGPVFVAFGFPPGTPKIMTREGLARFDAIPWAAAPSFVQVPNTASYSPVFYVPASFGLGLGHVLGLSPFKALLLARLSGVAAFAALGAGALLLARRSHAVLFATLTLPMTIWLGATLNQDGVMIAALCLAAALLTRAHGPQGWPYWTAGILLTLVIAVKPPYFLFAAAMLLPWQRRVRGQAPAVIAGIALALLPAAVWTVVAQALASGKFVFGLPYHPGPLWPGDPATLFPAPDAGAQLQVFLHRPALLIQLAMDRIREEGQWKIVEMIGVLGPLSLVMPQVAYTAWKFALGSAMVSALAGRAEGGSRPSVIGMAAVGVALAGTVFVVHDAQYLSWTTVGKESIDGVQGRYFLPLLPILGIALPVLPIRGGAWLRGAFALPTVALSMAGMVGLPLLLLHTYYLP